MTDGLDVFGVSHKKLKQTLPQALTYQVWWSAQPISLFRPATHMLSSESPRNTHCSKTIGTVKMLWFMLSSGCRCHESIAFSQGSSTGTTRQWNLEGTNLLISNQVYGQLYASSCVCF